jgi:hypothetical protein
MRSFSASVQSVFRDAIEMKPVESSFDVILCGGVASFNGAGRVFALQLPGNLQHACSVLNITSAGWGAKPAVPSRPAHENQKLEVAWPRSQGHYSLILDQTRYLSG